MSKELEPTVPLDTSQLTTAFVDEEATVIVVCHQCGILYSAKEKNRTTVIVAEWAACDHGLYFSSPHHVSVITGVTPALLEETFVISEDPELEQMPFSFPNRHFSPPIK